MARYSELEYYIARSGMTNDQIAEKMNVHPNTLYNKRNGRTEFSVREALFLLNLLRIPQTEVFKVFVLDLLE